MEQNSSTVFLHLFKKPDISLPCITRRQNKKVKEERKNRNLTPHCNEKDEINDSRTVDFHDVLRPRRVEGIENGLSLGHAELGLSISEGGGDRRWVREVTVVAEGIDCPALDVLPHVVV